MSREHKLFMLTFTLWNPLSDSYDQELTESFYEFSPPIPDVGEDVLINVSDKGTLPEYQTWTVARRTFEYTTGPIQELNVPGQVVAEIIGVNLYVRQRRRTTEPERVPTDS